MNKIFQDILIDALNTNSWRLADNQWVTEAAQLVEEEEEEEGGGWRSIASRSDILNLPTSVT